MCRLNWLHPPFDKVEARQAMLHLIKQEDILKAVFGNPEYLPLHRCLPAPARCRAM